MGTHAVTARRIFRWGPFENAIGRHCRGAGRPRSDCGFEGWQFRMVASGIGATAPFLCLSGHHMGLRQDSNLSVSAALIARLGRI